MRSAALCIIVASIVSCGGDSRAVPSSVSESVMQDTSAASVPTATSDDSGAGSAPPADPPVTTPPPSPDGMATATPEQRYPGDRVTITPRSVVQRNCADIVGVYDLDDVIVGQVLGGDQWEPAPVGAPPTWPACLGATTDAAMDVVVPPLPSGGYRFCLSVSVDFVDCATVFVLESE